MYYQLLMLYSHCLGLIFFYVCMYGQLLQKLNQQCDVFLLSPSAQTSSTLLDDDAMKMLVHAFLITSRVDYCNAVLAGSPKSLTLYTTCAECSSSSRLKHSQVRRVYFMTSYTGLTSLNESSTSSLSWSPGVWRTKLRITWASIALRLPPSVADIYDQPTSISWLYRAVGGLHLAVGLYLLQARRPGTIPTELRSPALRWIWNFPFIYTSISTDFFVDIHGNIHGYIHGYTHGLPIACLWLTSVTCTRSSATAERQRVSYTRLSRFTHWSCTSLSTASVLQLYNRLAKLVSTLSADKSCDMRTLSRIGHSRSFKVILIGAGGNPEWSVVAMCN